MELVDMLKQPAKYGKLGARLPKVTEPAPMAVVVTCHACWPHATHS